MEINLSSLLVKIYFHIYDAVFKELLAKEDNINRLENLISSLLGRKVKIIKVLPIESPRLVITESMMVVDIVVEFEDGSLANVEIQKVGYLFQGQRAACYSADLLLRKYTDLKRKMKDRKKLGDGEDFDYRDLKDVYLIVFFENSPGKFHAYYKANKGDGKADRRQR